MSDLLIGLVGPCAAGKTTIAGLLKEKGYSVRQIAQEHSYVPYMWKRITNPDLLVYLEVTYENTMLRKALRWTQAEYQIQISRLEHARQHADLTINTNILTPDQAVTRILLAIEHLRHRD